MRAKSPHLVKLTGVDPLGVVLPLKRRVPIVAGVEPARVWRRLQSSASLISSDLQIGRTRGHKSVASLFLSPFRVVGADSCASLFNAFASTGKDAP